MGVKLSKLKQVEEFVWIHYYPGGFESEDAVMSFQIRSMRSPVVIKRNRQLLLTGGNKTKSDKQQEQLLIKLIAETVIQDWRGLLDDNDNEIKYSSEEAIKVLTEYREIADFLADESSKVENFRNIADTEEVVKNSKSA